LVFIKFINIDCNCQFASKSALSYHLKSQHSPKKSIKPTTKTSRSKFNDDIIKYVTLETQQKTGHDDT
jgi:hypothetical protein